MSLSTNFTDEGVSFARGQRGEEVDPRNVIKYFPMGDQSSSREVFFDEGDFDVVKVSFIRPPC